jgi:L-seryl-tRNA(Ser) seleniumtransferase
MWFLGITSKPYPVMSGIIRLTCTGIPASLPRYSGRPAPVLTPGLLRCRRLPGGIVTDVVPSLPDPRLPDSRLPDPRLPDPRLPDPRLVPPDRRLVPRTDVLLADPRLAAAEFRLGRALVKAAVTRAQQRARSGEIAVDMTTVADAAVAELPRYAATLTPVINATGILVHTNLGRAPLSASAIDALVAAAGTCDVEFDLATGARGRRGSGALDALARAIPAAEAVAVVNNNAAALVLAATALAGSGSAPAALPPAGPAAAAPTPLAAGREIVVSRGELIEIGDRFRLPDLLVSTGARLREVGTTNRTSVADYAQVIGPDTAFILKVHPSNYRIEGFTAAAEVAELTGLGVPVVFDIGSGLLAPHPLLPDEPSADAALRAGASLVTASGDKLLGGPQAGLLAGRADLVHSLIRHPLARALRVDKLTLAALEATLTGVVPPVTQALLADPAQLFIRAERAVASLHQDSIDATVVPATAAVGGGGAPGVALPSVAISLPAAFAGPLRSGPAVLAGEHPAVIGRLEAGQLLLDLRSIRLQDDGALVAAICAAAVLPGHRGVS